MATALAEAETRQRLLRTVKKEVKQIMEEAVTRKFVHEDSSHIVSFCAAVEACILHGLKRRAAGFLRSNKVAALFTKVAKCFPPAEELCKKAQEVEQLMDTSRRSQTLASQDSIRKLPRIPSLTPQGHKHLWIRTALIEKVLDKIVLYLVENSSKFYEKEAIMMDPVDGHILASLLVGPCALEYTKMKTADHFWTDPSADELMQRHRIHSGHCRQDSPTKRPALCIQKRHSSSSIDERPSPSPSARDYVESLHQNSRATLLFGKNNVLVQPRDDMEAIPGYLSLHQMADVMTLKWTPNQLMNRSMGELEYERSVYWDYAMTIPLEEIVYLHCHQQVDSGGTVVLVSQDGIQRPPLRFPRGGHLLQFLSCLENGLLPHGQLDPPLWAQRGKGKVFPPLRKRGTPSTSDSSTLDKEEDEATDYVFRILFPNSQSEFAPPELMEQAPPIWQPTPRKSSCSSCSQSSFSEGAPPNGCNHERAPLKLLCDNMKYQIISRAFYGWLAYCRHLSTVRTHLSALVNHTIVAPDAPCDACSGLTADVWQSFLQDCSSCEETELLRLVYFGGVEPSLRKEVWPFLLGHYRFGMTEDKRKEVDEQVRVYYEQTMSEWQGCEAVVKQREREQHAVALAKCSSGASIDSTSTSQKLMHRDSTLSNESSQSCSSDRQPRLQSDSSSSTQFFTSNPFPWSSMLPFGFFLQVFESVEEVEQIETEPSFKQGDEPQKAPQKMANGGTLQNGSTGSPDSGHPSSRNFSTASGLSDSLSTEDSGVHEPSARPQQPSASPQVASQGQQGQFEGQGQGQQDQSTGQQGQQAQEATPQQVQSPEGQQVQTASPQQVQSPQIEQVQEAKPSQVQLPEGQQLSSDIQQEQMASPQQMGSPEHQQVLEVTLQQVQSDEVQENTPPLVQSPPENLQLSPESQQEQSSVPKQDLKPQSPQSQSLLMPTSPLPQAPSQTQEVQAASLQQEQSPDSKEFSSQSQEGQTTLPQQVVSPHSPQDPKMPSPQSSRMPTLPLQQVPSPSQEVPSPQSEQVPTTSTQQVQSPQIELAEKDTTQQMSPQSEQTQAVSLSSEQVDTATASKVQSPQTKQMQTASPQQAVSPQSEQLPTSSPQQVASPQSEPVETATSPKVQSPQTQEAPIASPQQVQSPHSELVQQVSPHIEQMPSTTPQQVSPQRKQVETAAATPKVQPPESEQVQSPVSPRPLISADPKTPKEGESEKQEEESQQDQESPVVTEVTMVTQVVNEEADKARSEEKTVEVEEDGIHGEDNVSVAAEVKNVVEDEREEENEVAVEKDSSGKDEDTEGAEEGSQVDDIAMETGASVTEERKIQCAKEGSGTEESDEIEEMVERVNEKEETAKNEKHTDAEADREKETEKTITEDPDREAEHEKSLEAETERKKAKQTNAEADTVREKEETGIDVTEEPDRETETETGSKTEAESDTGALLVMVSETAECADTSEASTEEDLSRAQVVGGIMVAETKADFTSEAAAQQQPIHIAAAAAEQEDSMSETGKSIDTKGGDTPSDTEGARCEILEDVTSPGAEKPAERQQDDTSDMSREVIAETEEISMPITTEVQAEPIINTEAVDTKTTDIRADTLHKSEDLETVEPLPDTVLQTDTTNVNDDTATEVDQGIKAAGTDRLSLTGQNGSCEETEESAKSCKMETAVPEKDDNDNKAVVEMKDASALTTEDETDDDMGKSTTSPHDSADTPGDMATSGDKNLAGGEEKQRGEESTKGAMTSISAEETDGGTEEVISDAMSVTGEAAEADTERSPATDINTHLEDNEAEDIDSNIKKQDSGNRTESTPPPPAFTPPPEESQVTPCLTQVTKVLEMESTMPPEPQVPASTPETIPPEPQVPESTPQTIPPEPQVPESTPQTIPPERQVPSSTIPPERQVPASILQTIPPERQVPISMIPQANRVLEVVMVHQPQAPPDAPDSDESPTAIEMEDIPTAQASWPAKSSFDAGTADQSKGEVAGPTTDMGTKQASEDSKEAGMESLYPQFDSLVGASEKAESTAGPSVPSTSTPYSQELLDVYTLNLHRIDKDVQRCDRNYWYFTPANLEKLRNIMCSYIWRHLDTGYVQGMCDLLAPLLVILDDEALAYSCFSELMKRMNQNFPHGGAMDTHFANMRSLIQILDSELFELMHQNGDYTHFYFCYRWFLLDFKRELVYDDVFSVWETIWAAKCVSSSHFVLFIALALVEIYRDIILENNMDFTDIIKFFNEMAEHHNIKQILTLARELVCQVQTLIENK
ncbi:microtubule-associated protein futsch [Engraulis encrasicolus]|uniref:microtubule-associated protein futsch n=1 Tax=Engraulis encrasicolus TaxID=184585 RepID=UPI002FD2DC3C